MSAPRLRDDPAGRITRSSFFRSKPFRTALLVVLMLVGAEALLQARAHLRYGRSIYAAVTGATITVYQEEVGTTLLRPNAVIEGTRARIVTNSLGLRSPEIPITPRPREIRIAVVGASSVMGAYAANNESTFSYILANLLRDAYPDRPSTVINAGIAGHTMKDHSLVLERVVVPLAPSVVVLYPGLNDVSTHCRKSRPVTLGAQAIQLPSWVLLRELALKNTVWLRSPAAANLGKLDPTSLDIGHFQRSLSRFASVAREHGIALVLATHSSAYRPGMPQSLLLRLSETDRYYNDCFDVPGLIAIKRRYNQVIRAVAGAEGAVLADLEDTIPGGDRYFVDAHHFSDDGERLVATFMFNVMTRSGVFATPAKPSGA